MRLSIKFTDVVGDTLIVYVSESVKQSPLYALTFISSPAELKSIIVIELDVDFPSELKEARPDGFLKNSK